MKRAIVFALVIVAGFLAADYCLAIDRSAIVIGSRVQIHESPAGDATTVGLINEGTFINVLGRQPKPVYVEDFTDYWYLVAYRGKTGWIFGQFLVLSTGGRGLARIFTADELIDYCNRATRNLVGIRDAGIYSALVDASGRLIDDIREMSEDPVLSAYGRDIEPYRLFAACLLAVGYAGIGDIASAEKVKKQLLTYDPGIPLPDRTTLGIKIDELDEMIQGKNRSPQ